MKPNILIRRGNQFIINERKVLPYMKNNLDLINAAVSVACQDFKLNPNNYKSLKQNEKIDKLNELVYEILEKWGIYHG